MTFKALFYAYVLGGLTFIPLVLAGSVIFIIYTSVPVVETEEVKKRKRPLSIQNDETDGPLLETEDPSVSALDTDDIPRTRKGWLTVRRTFEESLPDGSYVNIMRSFLDTRSKDSKRSRPKDMWYVVLKGTVLYLYEDEEMTECEAAVELGGHEVVVYPEGLLDGELFAKRNAICLKPKKIEDDNQLPSVTKEMKLGSEDIDAKVQKKSSSPKRQEKERERLIEAEKAKQAAREEALDPTVPWFIFVRSIVEMEDWYLALVHASTQPTKTPSLAPLQPVFLPSDMDHLLSNLDEQPDVIPTRWFNALIGRLFFSYYRTHKLESYIIGRLMKKLSKIKKPTFLTDIVVTEVSVGNRAPTFSKPMLKELTKEGDAAMEVHFHYKGEFRITIEATANISFGAFKSYNVKLALAVVLKELEGNLLIKIKRPPSNRIWYAFTQQPRMVLAVEPIVSDRQITWSMILGTIESKLREIIQESVVLPNMDDIAFFDSSKSSHRGGIWADASRHEKVASPILEQANVVDDAQSTASAPVPSASHTVGEETSKLSHSAEELPLTSEPTVSPTPPPMTSDASNERPQPPLMENRRSSWFSSVRSEGSTARKSILPSDDDEEIDDSMQRGRSRESDKASIASSRSRSSPQSSDAQSRDTTPEDDKSSFLNPYLKPQGQAARRSSSQHSLSHNKSLSTESSKSAPASETESGRTSNSTNSGSASSFLATLKSRAGDKQALSNTAKEAMKKWGVNWGTRKDSTNDDLSDHGSIGSAIGSRLRDANFGVASKARASYAEVRAAVAERKGKATAVNDEGDDHSRSSSPSTLPVPIPKGSGGKARTVSNPTSPILEPSDNVAPGPSSYPESIALSTSAKSASSSSKSGVSHVSSPPILRTTAEGENTAPIQPSKPIHVVQPTAKTMTIPGIHASHRGEIMSMGYVAPPQPPPMNSSEGKSSIYRLFNKTTTSSSSGGSDTGPNSGSIPDASQPPPSSSQETTYHDSSVTLDKMSRETSTLAPPQPSSNVIASSPISPRVPPPLPPRSPHTARSQAPPSPTAQERLKTIAARDDQKRISPPSCENGACENGDMVPSTADTSKNGVGDNGSVVVNDAETDVITSNTTAAFVSDLDHSPQESPTTPKKIVTSSNAPPLPPRRPQPQVSEAQA
ncbi:hypothetical protein H0H92_004479 [Tricholoma furcatifolium]|nr:hypothetical protein H0H92_004479 [Tricholoma furcatifolium]